MSPNHRPETVRNFYIFLAEAGSEEKYIHYSICYILVFFAWPVAVISTHNPKGAHHEEINLHPAGPAVAVRSDRRRPSDPAEIELINS